MSATLNRVTLIGHLGKDPEIRNFDNGGKVANFSIATSDRWTDKDSGEKRERTSWHQISVFNDALTEVVGKYLKKGSYVYLEGQLETRSYDKDSETRFATEVVLRPFAGELKMLDKAPERPAPQPAQQRQQRPSGPSGRR